MEATMEKDRSQALENRLHRAGVPMSSSELAPPKSRYLKPEMDTACRRLLDTESKFRTLISCGDEESSLTGKPRWDEFKAAEMVEAMAAKEPKAYPIIAATRFDKVLYALRVWRKDNHISIKEVMENWARGYDADAAE